VGNHAPNRPVKDFGWRTVVEGSRLFGIYNMTLVKEVVVPELHISRALVQKSPRFSYYTTHFVSEKASRDVDLLASDDDNFLAREDLLRDD
jgi:hypothetical protein